MYNTHMIKAVIFDVDGVLVNSHKANLVFYHALLEEAGYPEITDDDIRANYHLSSLHAIEKLTKSTDQNEIKRIWELGHEPRFRKNNLLEFPEKLEEILEELHKKYRLAIVTSRIRLGMDSIFGIKQIEHLFDAVITFEDYKNTKPHPEPLLVALKQLGITANEAIYIGDSSTDIEAAKAAGMKSVFLSTKPHEDAHANITEFSHLTEAVAKLAT